MKKLSIKGYQMIRLERISNLALRKIRAMYKVNENVKFDLNNPLVNEKQKCLRIYIQSQRKIRKLFLTDF